MKNVSLTEFWYRSKELVYYQKIYIIVTHELVAWKHFLVNLWELFSILHVHMFFKHTLYCVNCVEMIRIFNIFINEYFCPFQMVKWS